jgi:hypothetical protein
VIPIACVPRCLTGWPATGLAQNSAPWPTDGGGPRRSADGRREVVAASAASVVTLDGVLDDPVWAGVEPVAHFVQSEPDEGKPATQNTVVRIAVEAEYLYVAAYCYDDPRQLVVTDIRKDFAREAQDGFEVIFDTFGDRRNGYVFATNPDGARADEQVTNEGRDVNTSWDSPWTVHTRRVTDGWTLEMAIPLRSLRSRTDAGFWGVDFLRRIRRDNEVDYWAPIPRACTLARLSLAGNLTGLNLSGKARDLRVRPYMAGETVRQTGLTGFDQNGGAGLDLKYGLTKGLTLDVTINPDFAQSEADEQQVNLSQFSQFFPEKRDFFLENSGMFYLGDTPRNRRVALAPSVDEDLLLFFSRRMGLSDSGQRIGIDGGVRLTGQEGRFQVGALALRTRDLDSTVRGSNCAVVRLRRNLFSYSDVGALFMMRSGVRDPGNYNRVYGVDANVRLPARVDWSSYVVNSETPGLSGPRYAWYTSFNREANLVHTKGGVLSIGDDFNDELGFFRRTGGMKWLLDTGIRPRFATLRRLGVREVHPHVVWNYYTDHGMRRVARDLHNGYTFFLNNGGFSELSVNLKGQVLTESFDLDPYVDSLAPGYYSWAEYQWRLTSDESRAISVGLTGIAGGLWNGTQRTVNASATVKPSHHLTAGLGVQRTSGKLPGGDFVRAIWTGRANYSFTTNMFLDALTQYDAERHRLNLNMRFNFIHHPLSNVYLVWNEQRFIQDTPLDYPLGAPPPGRSVVVKVTHMLSL